MARKIIIGDQEFIVPDKFPKSGVTIGLILVFIYAIWSYIYRVELEAVSYTHLTLQTICSV